MHTDKGNTTIMMNTINYDVKVHNLLDDRESNYPFKITLFAHYRKYPFVIVEK